jgi:TonB family protein
MREIPHNIVTFARRAVLAATIALVIAAGSQGQESTLPAPAQQTKQAAPSTIPSYPNSTKGLENLMRDMTKLVEKGDSGTLASYTKALAIPDPQTWYKSTFGDETGLLLANASEPARSSIEADAQTTISSVWNKGMTDIHATKFEDSCNDSATDKEYPILLLRERNEPLFDVRFYNNSNTGVMWGFFAYVDGGFRYVGEIEKRLPPNYSKRTPGRVQDPSAVKVPGGVQAAKLIHQEMPFYPAVQKSHGQQDDVVLHAVIGKDGSIYDLNLIQGQCAFAKSAIEAVKKWRYSPTKLNGEPVEVDTTITVKYELGR